MWECGTVEIDGERYRYEAKVYDEGSRFGIDGGRVSKLHVTIGGVTVAAYDRGWDVYPDQETAKAVYRILACFSA